jgi:hypothetical protein
VWLSFDEPKLLKAVGHGHRPVSLDPGADHIGGFLVDPAAYESAVVDFLNRALATTSSSNRQ